MRFRPTLPFVLLVLALTLPAVAADIPRGLDVFTTPASGTTAYSFAQNPIPAGFFCPGSAAFDGAVVLKGQPLATNLPADVGPIDTIVERLDDAAFDARGVAQTRIRLRALSLVSLEPIRTSCGPFRVVVSLAGAQRETIMRLERQGERHGVFYAPLAVDARMRFVPLRGQVTRPLELVGSFTFPVAQPISWVLASPGAERSAPVVEVDLDRNGSVDLELPALGRFVAGGRLADLDKAGQTFERREQCIDYWEQCHGDPSTGKQHCTVYCGLIP